MEQLSARIADRIIYLDIISIDDRDCFSYSVCCKASPVPPWPDCRIILHQPKRPKK